MAFYQNQNGITVSVDLSTLHTLLTNAKPHEPIIYAQLDQSTLTFYALIIIADEIRCYPFSPGNQTNDTAGTHTYSLMNADLIPIHDVTSSESPPIFMTNIAANTLPFFQERQVSVNIPPLSQATQDFLSTVTLCDYYDCHCPALKKLDLKDLIETHQGQYHVTFFELLDDLISRNVESASHFLRACLVLEASHLERERRHLSRIQQKEVAFIRYLFSPTVITKLVIQDPKPPILSIIRYFIDGIQQRLPVNLRLLDADSIICLYTQTLQEKPLGDPTCISVVHDGFLVNNPYGLATNHLAVYEFLALIQKESTSREALEKKLKTLLERPNLYRLRHTINAILQHSLSDTCECLDYCDVVDLVLATHQTEEKKQQLHLLAQIIKTPFSLQDVIRTSSLPEPSKRSLLTTLNSLRIPEPIAHDLKELPGIFRQLMQHQASFQQLWSLLSTPYDSDCTLVALLGKDETPSKPLLNLMKAIPTEQWQSYISPLLLQFFKKHGRSPATQNLLPNILCGLGATETQMFFHALDCETFTALLPDQRQLAIIYHAMKDIRLRICFLREVISHPNADILIRDLETFQFLFIHLPKEEKSTLAQKFLRPLLSAHSLTLYSLLDTLAQTLQRSRLSDNIIILLDALTDPYIQSSIEACASDQLARIFLLLPDQKTANRLLKQTEALQHCLSKKDGLCVFLKTLSQQLVLPEWTDRILEQLIELILTISSHPIQSYEAMEEILRHTPACFRSTIFLKLEDQGLTQSFITTMQQFNVIRNLCEDQYTKDQCQTLLHQHYRKVLYTFLTDYLEIIKTDKFNIFKNKTLTALKRQQVETLITALTANAEHPVNIETLSTLLQQALVVNVCLESSKNPQRSRLGLCLQTAIDSLPRSLSTTQGSIDTRIANAPYLTYLSNIMSIKNNTGQPLTSTDINAHVATAEATCSKSNLGKSEKRTAAKTIIQGRLYLSFLQGGNPQTITAVLRERAEKESNSLENLAMAGIFSKRTAMLITTLSKAVLRENKKGEMPHERIPELTHHNSSRLTLSSRGDNDDARSECSMGVASTYRSL